MMVRIECTSCGHVGVVHAETLVRELAALRHDLSNVKARLEAGRLSCTAR
jgi:hypothetical protein